MKTTLRLVIALTAGGGMRAGGVEQAIIAAMQLSHESSYSWRCSVVDDARAYEIEGKKRADGYIWQQQPMPKAIARRLGRGGGDLLEAIFLRDTYTYVIATENGWRKLRELPKQDGDWCDDDWFYVSVPVLPGADMPADAAEIDPFGLPPAIYVPVLRDHGEADEHRAYSNAQFALALPDQELAVIVSSYAAMSVEGNVVTGRLSDLGAQLLLVHDGHEYIKPVIANGRFTLWLHGGTVAKYLVELAGIVLVERKTVYVRQRATTVLKDVGMTTFDVPPEAQRRLASR